MVIVTMFKISLSFLVTYRLHESLGYVIGTCSGGVQFKLEIFLCL